MTDRKNLSHQLQVGRWLYCELRWKLKQANQENGRLSQQIHLLRAELAELRQKHSRIERGDLTRLENQNAVLTERYLDVSQRNRVLRDTIDQFRAATP
jgi:predicted nuclease with TOPRIM domain